MRPWPPWIPLDGLGAADWGMGWAWAEAAACSHLVPGPQPGTHTVPAFQLERLRASYEELQAQSREEIQCLGAQLESARSSRQELSGEHLVFPVQVPGRESCSLNF